MHRRTSSSYLFRMLAISAWGKVDGPRLGLIFPSESIPVRFAPVPHRELGENFLHNPS